MHTGKQFSIEIDDTLDDDNEVTIYVDIEDYIDEGMALDVIRHLVTVFGMSGLQAAVSKYEEDRS